MCVCGKTTSSNGLNEDYYNLYQCCYIKSNQEKPQDIEFRPNYIIVVPKTSGFAANIALFSVVPSQSGENQLRHTK